jgi:hypothetical protein
LSQKQIEKNFHWSDLRQQFKLDKTYLFGLRHRSLKNGQFFKVTFAGRGLQIRFSYQKYQEGYILNGRGLKNVSIFYDHFHYFLPFSTLHGYLVTLWSFGGHLVDFPPFCT